jgi:2-methylisocitrate lyase-like PEP mutase family enzyme
MPNGREEFKELIARPGIVMQPVIYDALSALLARRAGFDALGLGGYQMGAHLGTSEPLLGLEDVASVTRYIRNAVEDTPVMVDAGAGFGEPLHVMHATRILEQAGATSVHIEDQIFPKRAHYHKGLEHVIDADAMVRKIRAAVSARRDPDLAIVARTDAIATDGYDEAVRRAALYAEAGADLLMLFPSDDSEARQLPVDLPDIPLIYINSAGNRLGRPAYTADELEAIGYKIAIYAIGVSIAAAAAIEEFLNGLRAAGTFTGDPEKLIAGRLAIENVIGLDEYYAIELETVER